MSELASTTNRDVQRQRVYNAERALHNYTQTIPNSQLQKFVDDALDKRAVRARWPHAQVEVVLKRGGKAYGYRYGGGSGRITLPLFSRNPAIILHEVAHVLTPNTYQSHGPEFAGVLLFLVKTVMGTDAAAELRKSFKEERARYNNKAVPKPRAADRVPAARSVKEKQERRAASVKARTPRTHEQRKGAASVLRAEIASGRFGAAGTQSRRRALDVARRLEEQS